ncbi:hypothetical protein HU200_065871 [Digitaria exilis]|uniref:BHLH domain-containing protein n=1 Tax=Digitaria exilis TaxID=1010633 RepID=A0A835DU94_9POAL|nr:hypothetical protein HU200_065871 [Digitaria exilis]
MQFRNHLAAAVRSINWSYAIFWVLRWRDGFYNGETKTRKVTSTSSRLTAGQLALQRSEQLRELYESLQPPGDGRATPRPIAALSPEDLGDTEWFYLVCMTYAFRPGQGLPGKSLARNEHVWLRNAHLADSKTFPRALIAKTIVCIPLMGGVLELGTTESVMEDHDMVNRATAPFREPPPQLPACTEEPTSSPSSDDNRDQQASEDTIAFDFEDIDDHTAAMEPMIFTDTEHPPDASNLEDQVAMEIGELYGLGLEDVQVQLVEDDWFLTIPPSPPAQPAATKLAGADDGDHALMNTPGDGSRFTSFKPWTRSDAGDMAGGTAATGREPQKLLKKVVAGGGAWTSNGGGGDGSMTRATTQESGIRNHVMSERKRREKLNEMFVVLKSLIPSTRKGIVRIGYLTKMAPRQTETQMSLQVDKASILAETVAYLKELERRVHELESRNEPVEVVGATNKKKVAVASGGAKRRKKGSDDELDAGDHRRQSWVGSPSNVISITVEDREVVLDVKCRWEERLMARVFDAVKSFHLNILSIQSSTLDGIMGLKVRAQFASSAVVAPGMMITEALQEAISSRKD